MERLYPIANASTRHLFVDPSIYRPWDIIDDRYPYQQTGYLKPGKIPNLMALCMSDDVGYTVTQEPDTDKMVIEDILFGMKYEGVWTVFRKSTQTRLTQLDQGTWGLEGLLLIPTDSVREVETGEKGIALPDTKHIHLDMNVKYSRATRCLEFTTSGTYDNGKPQILGITFDLEYKDSKSLDLPFKHTDYVNPYARPIEP